MFRLGILLFATAMLVFVPPSTAQQADSCVARTGSNATLIIPDTLTATVNDSSLGPPFKISVMTEEGTCAGTTQWTGASTTLTAWGKTSPNPSQGALSPGSSITIRVGLPNGDTYSPKNSQIDVIFSKKRPYLVSEPVYQPHGIYVIQAFHIHSSVQAQRNTD